jgi:hypothetical protein
MSSQEAVQKNENGLRAFGWIRTSRLGAHRSAGSRRKVTRRVAASAVLLSILVLAFPSTPVTRVGLARRKKDAKVGLPQLPQTDIDAINALAAFNIGTPYQAPQALPSGVVMATAIGSDPGFPPLFNGPVKSVKEMVPLIRDAAARLLNNYSGGTFLSSKPLPPPYARKGYRGAASRVSAISPTRVCEQTEGAGNCEPVGDLAYPKCKPGFTGSAEMCNPVPDPGDISSPKSQELIAKVVKNAGTNPDTRMKLAPFMLQVAFEALAANNPTPQQQAFYKYFQYYAGWQNQMVTQRTLVQWCKHKKNWPQSPASVFIGTGNAKSASFQPKPEPMSMGTNGALAVDQLLTPAMAFDLAGRDPFWQASFPDAAKGLPMNNVLTSLGFSQPAAAAIMVSMMGDLPDGWPGSKLPEAAKIQKILTDTVAPAVAKNVGIKIGQAALARLIGGAIGTAIAEGLGLPASIIAIALEILIKNIIAEVETPKFEAGLVKGSREVLPVDVRSLIHTSKAGYGDGLKIGVMAHLIKVMIIDPADATAFGPSMNQVLDPFQQLNPNAPCSGLEEQGLLR